MPLLTPWWRLSRGKINLGPISLKTFLIFLLIAIFFPVPVVLAGEGAAVYREQHWAVTAEKFELALERLRVGKKTRIQSPIVLVHGLFVNSLFFNLDEEQSLARYLAKEGFDVWNLSLRGTGRSLGPLKGGAKSWTLDDIIEKDISAVIRYVQKESRNSQVIWVGYEMGGLLAYGYLEKKASPGLAALVTIGAPVTFNHPQQEPMKRLLKLEESPALKKIFLYLNSPFLGSYLIPLIPKMEEFFYNRENIEEEIKEKFLANALAEINPGILDHLLRIIQRGEFVSAEGNFSYRKNLAKIQLPLLLIGGEKDQVAPPEAIRTVYRAVGSTDRTLRILGPRSKNSAAYGHIDLILGKKAKEEVFSVISRWLKQRDGRE